MLATTRRYARVEVCIRVYAGQTHQFSLQILTGLIKFWYAVNHKDIFCYFFHCSLSE